ncbi:penicillin acylase family protein [Pseudoduganella violaceinigra]|uniref:penicillin acylase family protein n=1 Tax=Pseudoduganella violaceinigra TaxID=246602 RepID=UPI0003F7B2AC|nr:penicillin acylase family protein [Pseudoduganella violaceinigra]
MRQSFLSRVLAFIPCAVLAACSGSSGAAPAGPAAAPISGTNYVASIRYTSYGVPHVKADSFKGAGYGYGYAFAKENVCLYAEELVTLHGERARHFGGAGGYLGQLGDTFPNIDSDFFYKLTFTPALAANIKAASSQDAQDLTAGFVAGYNRYLKETPAASLPAACSGMAWVQPMTEDDAYLRFAQASMAGSSLAFIKQIGSAQPPKTAGAALRTGGKTRLLAAAGYTRSSIFQGMQALHEHAIGSNGFGLGRDVTQSGKGLVFGNPHFPWWGALRLNQLHLTVTGKGYDVYGATLLGVPLPLIGFNDKVAWTHTFSTDNRFTLRYLVLDPSNPTRYIKDGKPVVMTAVPLTISVKGADGAVTQLSRTLYTTEFGPMLMDSSFAWGTASAFAIQDANLANYKLIDQVILNGKSSSVDSLRQAALTHVAMPWVNTMAADSAGDTLYGNFSVAANVADAQLAGCVPGAAQGAPFQDIMASTGVVVMAGTSSACDWSGAVSAARRPWIKRSDYILNANDSHWWPSAGAFLTGYPKIIATGPNAEGAPQNNRTRTGHAIVRDRLAAADGLAGNRFTMANLQQIYLQARFFKAQKWLPEFTSACLASGSASAAAKDACTVLQDWDKTHAPGSAGAILFFELYAALGELNAGSWWSVPYNPADPLETPRGAANIPAAMAKLEALVAGSQFDTAAKRRTRPEEVQTLSRPDGSLAPPGGRYTFMNWRGVKNQIYPGIWIYTADSKTNAGAYGNSYLQFVTWDDGGPVAEGMLTYGQSSNPDSPHFNDLTKLYVKGQWVKLPYTEAQITADPNYKLLNISE